jgi:hypothetical protein
MHKLYDQVAMPYDRDLHLQRTGLKPSLNAVIEERTYMEVLGQLDTGKTDNVKGTCWFTLHLDVGGQWRFSRMEWY